MTTTLIQGGTLIDGTGAPAAPGSLLIEDDGIAAIIPAGQPLPAAATVIVADGLAVAPGFIDMHSHADWVLPLDDHPEVLGCLVEQGVTTVVGGNCGISPAPVTAQSIARLETLAAIAMAVPLDYRWTSMSGFRQEVDRRRPVVNLAQLVGHAALRYASSDTPRGPMTPSELAAGLDAARRALDEGACGLSFGLGYDPGMYAPVEELEAFCRVAAAADKPVTVHLKALSRISPCYPLFTPQAHNVRALEEMLAIARRTGVKLQLSHFIFVGRRTWPTAERCLRMVSDARRDGLDVMIDAFPYTCGNTTILAPIPYWFLADLPAAFHRPAARLRLRAELAAGFRLVGFGYDDFQVMEAAVAGWEGLNGRRISEIAADWRRPCFEVMLTLGEKSRGGTLMLFHAYSGAPGEEGVLEEVLKQDWCLFETDTVTKKTGYPNPAAMGTFPKVLGDFVRRRRLFGLEAAVRRMTGASAARFNLHDRGTLAPGKRADLTLFDPASVADSPPAGSRPAGRPAGIRHVFVNGRQVVRGGKMIPGVRAGGVL
jgi:N-acyl-D-amino-acid deacylase